MRTCHFVGFVMRRLNYCLSSMLHTMALSPKLAFNKKINTEAFHNRLSISQKMHLKVNMTDSGPITLSESIFLPSSVTFCFLFENVIKKTF